MKRLAAVVARQPEWILALAASVMVIWLHFFFLLHVGGFWRDEVNLINLSSRHSLAEMSRDSFPVLMPLLVSGWTALGLGRTDFSLRLLGTLIGLALPAALWLAVWKIRRAPPLLGLVLLALNSTVIMFGDSLRAFGLGSGLILLTMASAAWFLKDPGWRRAGLLVALAVLSVQALFQNAVFIAAICFGGWAVCARQKNWPAAVKIFVVAVVSAASLLPYWTRLVSLPESAAALRVGFNPMYVSINFDNAAGFPWKQYIWVWGFFALGVVICGFVPLFARTRTGGGLAGNTLLEGRPLFAPTTLLMAVAAVAGFFWFAASPGTRWWYFPLTAAAIAWLDFRSQTGAAVDRDLPLFAGVTLLVAFAGFAGFLWFAALISEPWYFLPLLALAAAAFELGLPLASRHLRAVIFGFAAMTIVLAVPATRADLNWRFTNLDLIGQRLTTEAAPGDFIIVSPWYCGISFGRYYQGGAPWDTLPPLKDHSLHRFDLVREQMETRGALRPVLEKISATLQSGRRVWVVGSMDIPKPGAPLPPDPPPPPLKYSGWSDRPYSSAWASQAVQFLSNHSRWFAQVYYTTNQSVNFSECLKLDMAEGWEDHATNPPAPASPRKSP